MILNLKSIKNQYIYKFVKVKLRVMEHIYTIIGTNVFLSQIIFQNQKSPLNKLTKNHHNEIIILGKQF